MANCQFEALQACVGVEDRSTREVTLVNVVSYVFETWLHESANTRVFCHKAVHFDEDQGFMARVLILFVFLDLPLDLIHGIDSGDAPVPCRLQDFDRDSLSSRTQFCMCSRPMKTTFVVGC